MPEEIARRQSRVAALEEARAVIEQRARERAAQERAEYERKAAERRARQARGERVGGRPPQPPSEIPGPKEQYNFTDPDSRIMKAGNGPHFEQAYNAQAAVAAVEQTPGGSPTGITVYVAVDKTDHHRTVADLEVRPEPEPLPAGASAKERMAHRLQSPAGRELYKLRKQTVEPVFGIIKEVMGFRRFRLRGREKASLEWLLVCVRYNLKRLFTLKNLAIAG